MSNMNKKYTAAVLLFAALICGGYAQMTKSIKSLELQRRRFCPYGNEQGKHRSRTAL